MLVLFLLVLFLILVIVAVRSKKMSRQKNFKDTKKVNMFIFCLFFDILLPLSLWWHLGNLGTSVALHIVAIPLHVAHNIGVILLCRLLLIVPKIWAPLLRHVRKLMKTR